MGNFHDISWLSVLKLVSYNSHITNLRLLFLRWFIVDFLDRQYLAANNNCFLPGYLNYLLP